MPHTLPPAIRLGGREWRFNETASTADVDGECHYAEAVLDIRAGQAPVLLVDSVLHELSHAILYSQGRENGGRVEETYVRALATGLAAALSDNPELSAWLFQRLHSET